MKYFLHDSNAFNDEKISELFIHFGYEGIGLFFTILEKLAAQEKPVKTLVLKQQLKIGKRLEKCWNFLEEIELISSNNGETFNERLINFAGKYKIKNEKNAKRISEWREKQADKKIVTCYDTVTERVRNADKVNKSKINKEYNVDVLSLIEFCKPLFNEKYLNGESHKCFDELIRIDKYSTDQIKQAIENGKKDEFWRNQFLSPAKLRSKNKDGIFYIDFFINLKSKQTIQTNQQNTLFDRYPHLKALTEKYPDGKYHPDSNRFVTGTMIFDCFSGKRVTV